MTTCYGPSEISNPLTIPCHNKNNNISDEEKPRTIPPPTRSSYLQRFLALDHIAISNHVSRKPHRGLSSGGKVTSNQLEYLQKVVKEALTLSVSEAFKIPVNYNMLNIPAYPTIILHRMDLGTIHKYLKSSSYSDAHECLCDLNQMFTNCYIFNSPNDPVVFYAVELEKFFRAKLKDLPYPEVIRPAPAKRGASMSTAGVKRSSGGGVSGSSNANKVARNDTPELLRQCENVLKELRSRRCQHLSAPFLEPVDVKKFNLLDYYDIVKQPMDIQTMSGKLAANKYRDHTEFNADFHLMINNCIIYNGKNSQYGKQAEKLLQMYQDMYKRFVLDLTNKLHAAPAPASTTPNHVQRYSGGSNDGHRSAVSLPPSTTTTPIPAQARPTPQPLPPPPQQLSVPLPSQSPAANVLVSSAIQPNTTTLSTPRLSNPSQLPHPPPPPHPSSHPPQKPANVSSSVTSAVSASSSFASTSNVPSAFADHVSHVPLLESTNAMQFFSRQNLGITEEEGEDLERLFMDVALMSEKSLELVTLLEDIRGRINHICDRRSITFATLQRMLAQSNKEKLPDFFLRPNDPDFAGAAKPVSGVLAKSSSFAVGGPDVPTFDTRNGEAQKKKKGRKSKLHERHSLAPINSQDFKDNTATSKVPFGVTGVTALSTGIQPQDALATVPGNKKSHSRHSKKKHLGVTSESLHSSNLAGYAFQNKMTSSITSGGVAHAVPVMSSENYPHLDYSSSTLATSVPEASSSMVDEVTYEEKAQLSESINALPRERLAKVVEIIQRYQRSPPSHSESHEIEVDFDQLQNDTLRALQEYVASVRREEELARQRKMHEYAAMMKQPKTDVSDSHVLLQRKETIENRLQNLADFEASCGTVDQRRIAYSDSSESDSDSTSDSSESDS